MIEPPTLEGAINADRARISGRERDRKAPREGVRSGPSAEVRPSSPSARLFLSAPVSVWGARVWLEEGVAGSDIVVRCHTAGVEVVLLTIPAGSAASAPAYLDGFRLDVNDPHQWECTDAGDGEWSRVMCRLDVWGTHPVHGHAPTVSGDWLTLYWVEES